MLIGTRCTFRPYRDNDIRTLPNLLNDYEVVRWMTASIPHPYTEPDARTWIANASGVLPTDNFAVEVDGMHAGGIGIIRISAREAASRNLVTSWGVPIGDAALQRKPRV